jgi:Protein of unknown function (DUF3306)
MTAPENFVSRWVRLKRERDVRRGPQPVDNGRPADAAALAGTEASEQHRRNDEIVEKSFDPSTLPSIETITGNTDIRGFLQSCVPAELTRAALRQAWASDPAIRDFIGIAENQWDFNDPNAIPGFGPLPESDNAQALLARAVGTSDESARVIPKISLVAEQPAAVTDRGHVTVELSSADPASSDSSKEEAGADAAEDRESEIEDNDPSRYRRRHGGALPR